MLGEQPYAQRDADDRVDEHHERLGGPQRPDVQRCLLQEQGRHGARGQGLDGPVGEHPATPNWVSVSVVTLMNVGN